MHQSPVICVGSALWDIIARAAREMKHGFDVPGRIERQLGGVALNIAVALARNDVRVELLSSIGRDPEGDVLIEAIDATGIGTSFLDRPDRHTDQYLAIELPDGEVFGAVADCHGLEARAEQVIAPLLGGAASSNTIVIDGNLPQATLSHLCLSDVLSNAHLFLVPASPGKAMRLKNLDGRERVTLTVNRVEAEIIFGEKMPSSAVAATRLVELGFGRAIVTDSARSASVASGSGVISATPPDVPVKTLTGAGDSFLAGFIAAGRQSDTKDQPRECLEAALLTAAKHISGGKG